MAGPLCLPVTQQVRRRQSWIERMNCTGLFLKPSAAFRRALSFCVFTTSICLGQINELRAEELILRCTVKGFGQMASRKFGDEFEKTFIIELAEGRAKSGDDEWKASGSNDSIILRRSEGGSLSEYHIDRLSGEISGQWNLTDRHDVWATYLGGRCEKARSF